MTSKGEHRGALGLLGTLLVGLGCSGEPEPAQTPPLLDEAGFVDIEPVGSSDLAQRLFYVFQAADTDAVNKPLVVFFNGGPGATTEILLGFNTAKRTVDQARTNGAAVADNPASWSRFANLLYLDAPNSGFSYALPANGSKTPAPNQFNEINYNPGLDAAQFTRAVIRFLDSHPGLTRNQVILAGESYGGVRATMMLHEILDQQHLAEEGQIYRDAALGAELDRHFRAIFPGVGAITPEIASRQFSGQVLIEPALEVGRCLSETAGVLLNQPDSPLFDVASKLGVPFVPCAAPCSKDGMSQARNAFFSLANRETYNILMSPAEYNARYHGSLAAFAHLPSLGAALGVDPMGISGLRAENRGGAVRGAAPGSWLEAGVPAVDQQSLIDAFGELGALDQYFIVLNMDVNHAFPFQGTFDFTNPLFTEIFLRNSLHVRTFVTQARFDMAIYAPAFPSCFETLPEVEHVEVGNDPADASPRPERMIVHFKPDAFPSEQRPLPTTTIRFPMYRESGHVVSMDQPKDLSADVEAWLREASK
jgi:hypothetical protein